jgi:hypothetical protein
MQFARGLWVIYAVALLALYLVSLPGYFERVLGGTVPDVAFNLDWPTGNAYFAARAAAAGLSLRGWLLADTAAALLIVALFLPLRRSVQDLIDRRFFRRKYDAAKVLEGFAATARDETDLDRLTAELARVIQETMEPESVSVWLRPAGDERRIASEEGDSR